MTSVDDMLAVAVEHLRPPPQLPLSEWLEATVRLPHGLAAESGPLRLWPTQKGIADALAGSRTGTHNARQGGAVRLHEPFDVHDRAPCRE